MEKLLIRKEEPQDYPKVRLVIEKAFENVEGDQSEGALVERLRQSEAYVPELSIVAVLGGRIVGHILFTKIKLGEGAQAAKKVLALAPVSVHPDHQGLGIGTQLITEGHRRAAQLGFVGVVLLGHESYYPRFGYQPASDFGIKAPWEVQDVNYMARTLVDSGLNGVSGTVEYAPEFFV